MPVVPKQIEVLRRRPSAANSLGHFERACFSATEMLGANDHIWQTLERVQSLEFASNNGVHGRVSARELSVAGPVIDALRSIATGRRRFENDEAYGFVATLPWACPCPPAPAPAPAPV
jgi:hypothetical protein